MGCHDRGLSLLNLVAFVPCYDDTSLEWNDSQCDVFVYSAAQLAADHINTHPTILINATVKIQALVPSVQVTSYVEQSISFLLVASDTRYSIR